MLSHRIRPVSEILAPHVEHLWVVRGYLAARWRNMCRTPVSIPCGVAMLIADMFGVNRTPGTLSLRIFG